jgi:hypothetical protein
MVYGFSFAGLTRMDGQVVEDINDLCRIDVDCDDQYRDALESLMDFAHAK